MNTRNAQIHGGRTHSLRVLAVPGSLRDGSYNRALVRAACELAPDSVLVEPYDVAEIPFYDEDVEAAGDPEPVSRFKRAIDRADALLIATPEYNAGPSGVLKNALDWASRPPRTSVLAGKPVAIMGASPSRGGTARAQAQLALVLESTGAAIVPNGQLRVAHASAKFDDTDVPTLADNETRHALRTLLEALHRAVDAAGTAIPGPDSHQAGITDPSTSMPEPAAA